MTPDTSPAHPGPLAPGTLGRRLVLRVVAIVAATSLALTATSLLALGRALEQQMDHQLLGLAHAQWTAATHPEAMPGGDIPGTRAPSSIIVSVDQDGTHGALLGADGTTSYELPARTTNLLTELPRDGQVRNVELPDLGQYRVWADDAPPASVGTAPGPPTDNGRQLTALVVAQSSAPTYGFLGTFALIMMVLTAVAIAVAILVVHTLIRKSLLPLTTLATTADTVSGMDLTHGGVTIAPVQDEDTSPNSEVNRVSAAFRRMLQHVADALRAREASETKVRQFVADASHELRNPLAAIRGYAEITRRDRDKMPPDAAFAMERIEAEAARMNRLVEDLLTLARLDSSPQLSTESADLGEILITALSDARASGPDHRWTIDLPLVSVMGIVDRHRIQQVLINLLTNARVHTPAGTHVCAALRVEGEDALYEISNDGPPVPADKQAAIFERFARLDPSRQRVGPGSTGLGLAIVRSVTEAHDGSIDLRSDEDGTVFTVRLPLGGPRGHDVADAHASPGT